MINTDRAGLFRFIPPPPPVHHVDSPSSLQPALEMVAPVFTLDSHPLRTRFTPASYGKVEK